MPTSSSVVTIYTSPTCSACTFSKRYMDAHHIPYDAVDVSVDPEALELIRSLGYGTAPVFVSKDGGHWQGFQPNLLDALVAEKAAA